jgi:hypothetical protein
MRIKMNALFASAGTIASLLLISSTAMMGGTATYDIFFTPPFTGSPEPTSAFFTYDYDDSQFTIFQVDWDGGVYELAAAADTAGRYNPPYGGCDPGVPSGTPQLGFIVATQTSTGCSTPPTYVFGVGNYDDTNVISVTFLEYEGGNLIASFSLGACCSTLPPASFTSGWTVSPEPGTLSMLLLAGLIAAGLKKMRRIWAGPQTNRPNSQTH